MQVWRFYFPVFRLINPSNRHKGRDEILVGLLVGLPRLADVALLCTTSSNGFPTSWNEAFSQ